MNFSMIMPFVRQLKNAELLEIHPLDVKLTREGLIQDFLQRDPEEILEILRTVEKYIRSRREIGLCLNPETGKQIKIGGPTYSRLCEQNREKELAPNLPKSVRDLYEIETKISKDIEEGASFDEMIQSTGPFSVVPDEVMLLMMQYLRAEDLARFCVTTKRTYLLASADEIQRAFGYNVTQYRFSTSGKSSAYIDQMGDLYVWGENNSQQFALPGVRRKDKWIPHQVNTLECGKPRSVFLTNGRMFVINTYGELWVAGRLSRGVLRRSHRKKSTSRFLKVHFERDLRFVEVYDGCYNVFIGLTSKGDVYVWNSDMNYYKSNTLLALEEESDIAPLYRVMLPEKIVKMCGETGTCVSENGTVFPFFAQMGTDSLATSLNKSFTEMKLPIREIWGPRTGTGACLCLSGLCIIVYYKEYHDPVPEIKQIYCETPILKMSVIRWGITVIIAFLTADQKIHIWKLVSYRRHHPGADLDLVNILEPEDYQIKAIDINFDYACDFRYCNPWGTNYTGLCYTDAVRLMVVGEEELAYYDFRTGKTEIENPAILSETGSSITHVGI